MSEPRLRSTAVNCPRIDQRGHRHTHGHDTEFQLTWLDGQFLSATGLWGLLPCSTCDAHPGFVLGPDGDTLVAKTSCPLPDGLESVVHLDVPSGRIIINDDLRPVFDAELPVAPSYNSAAGQVLHNETMARVGCAHGFVGNSSPSLVRTDPGRYVIGSFDPHLDPGGEVLANITTGVWSYAIADYDHYLGKAAGYDTQDLERHHWATVVDVEPGTYRFRNHTSRADFNLHGQRPLVFAHIERVGPSGGAR